MKKSITASIVAVLSLVSYMGISTAKSDDTHPLTAHEAFEVLDKSVVEFTKYPGKTMCTATAIAPRTFLTAGHCIKGEATFIVDQYGNEFKVSSVTVGVGMKEDYPGLQKDWAIVHTDLYVPGISYVAIGCDETLYVGMPVAYLGYPYPLNRHLGVGIISSIIEPDIITSNTAMASFNASSGASGSAVISLDTGNIIAILTTILTPPPGILLATGLEPISETDYCRDIAYDKRSNGPTSR